MNEIPAAGETFRGEDGTVSTILPANYGQDYEASEGELEEYAEYIGIDLAKEPELLWIAQEGLRAQLPDGWRACQTDDNEIYYFNFQTGDSLWDHPMDEHYKSKVITERAKHRSGGSGGGGASGAKTTAAAGVSSPVLAGGANSTRTGTTKALTDSLFLKPAATASSSPAANVFGTSILMSDGASAPRAPPDVSDILSLAAPAVATPSGGSSIGAAGFGTGGPFKLREAEAALRSKLEEQNEAQLRTLRIDYGKKEDAERQRLEESKTRLQKELDAAWEAAKAGGGPAAVPAASSATQRRLQTTREVKQIEESWQKRLHEVGARVREAQQQMAEKEQTLQKNIRHNPEELKKTLEARNAAELAQLREAARKQNEVALTRLKSEHAAAQAEAQKAVADMVAAAQQNSEASVALKGQEQRARNAAMLAVLQTAVKAKQKELTAVHDSSHKDVASEMAPTPAAPVGLSEADKAAIVAAQAAADAEVAEAKKAAQSTIAKLKEEYERKKRDKEASLRTSGTGAAAAAAAVVPARRASFSSISSAVTTPTRSASQVIGGGSFASKGLSVAEQAKLDEEDQKLKQEADKAARIFEEETELMVANKEAGRALTAVPTAAVAANVSEEAVASLARTAVQEQRARDTENTRHAMAVKQLESKHEQAVRAIKAQQERVVASSSAGGLSVFSPRQHPSFTAQLNARKRAWVRDHPAPTLEMPTLSPVPMVPVATMSAQMSQASMPDPDEQASIVKTRLKQLREEVQRTQERELQQLQRSKEEEIAQWQTTYRASRLSEVQQVMVQLKKEKEAEVAAARAREETESAATAASSAADAAAVMARQKTEKKAAATAVAAAALAEAQQKLSKAQQDRRELEMEVAAWEADRNTQMSALQRETAALEAALKALTDEEKTEEQRRLSYHAKLDAAAAAKVQHAAPLSPPPQPPAPAFSAAAVAGLPSLALCISDAEATEEEAALRTRWSALLKSLRAAVQREMEQYERALTEAPTAATLPPSSTSTHPIEAHTAPPSSMPGAGLSTPHDRHLTALSQGAVPATASQPSYAPPAASSFLPPPVPTAPPSASTEAPYAVMTLAPHHVPPPAGFATPQQLSQHPQPSMEPQYNNSYMITGGGGGECRQRRVEDPKLFASGAGGGGSVRYADPHWMPSYLSQPYPQQHHATGARGSLANAGHTAGFAAERGSRILDVPPEHHRPSSSTFARRGSRLSPRFSPDSEAEEDGSDSENSGQAEQAARLAALQQAVQERRRELLAQRHEMELLREEWKADMRACKQRDERTQARELRDVKQVLEERARKLNEEVLEVKQVQRQVQDEVQRYRQWTRQRHQLQKRQARPDSDSGDGAGARGQRSSATRIRQREAEEDTPSSLSVSPGELVSLLQSVVSRTERLEKLLLHRSSSPKVGGRSPSSSAAAVTGQARDSTRH